MEDQKRKNTESQALEMSKKKEHVERKKIETREHVSEGKVTRKARQEDKEQIEMPILGDTRGWRKRRGSEGRGER